MSSTSLDYPASSLQENPRPNGQVLTPRRRARHPISGSPSWPPMEARS